MTQALHVIPPSPHTPPSFCTSLVVLTDNEQELDEHLCLMITTNDRVNIVYNDTDYCPPQALTITIKDAGWLFIIQKLMLCIANEL